MYVKVTFRPPAGLFHAGKGLFKHFYVVCMQITSQPTAFCPLRRSPTSDSIIRREVRPTTYLRASSTGIGLIDGCTSPLSFEHLQQPIHPALDSQLAALFQTGLNIAVERAQNPCVTRIRFLSLTYRSMLRYKVCSHPRSWSFHYIYIAILS